MSDLEAETFSRALPEMALALSKAKLERSLANLTHAASEITKAERRRIAQDLHDGLAQNLSYMRLKLEQLSNDGSALATGKIQHDIKHLFKAASEAYEQVRSTLNELEPSCGDNLETTLRERAGFMAERAGLDISVILHGAPQPLSPECLRQVLYIFQESLINIEKHAQAHTANVEGHWTPRELILIIADDGVGFHPDADKKDQHWGITIMRQRAQSVGGNLTVESEVGAGTQVKFRVPVAGSGNYLPQGR